MDEGAFIAIGKRQGECQVGIDESEHWRGKGREEVAEFRRAIPRGSFHWGRLDRDDQTGLCEAGGSLRESIGQMALSTVDVAESVGVQPGRNEIGGVYRKSE